MDITNAISLFTAATALFAATITFHLGRKRTNIQMGELRERRIYKLIDAISDFHGVIASLPPATRKLSSEQDKEFFAAKTKLHVLLATAGSHSSALPSIFDRMLDSKNDAEFENYSAEARTLASQIVADLWARLPEQSIDS